MAAVTTPYLSVEQYLRSRYEPDADYVDGHIEERSVGEFDHNTVQYRVTRYFDDHHREWRIRFAIEQRVQTSQFRFRIPDICILDANGPKEQIVRRAPLLCVEVLSPEDTLTRTLVRAQDFFNMGVPEVWIIDPEKRTLLACTPDAKTEHRSGIVHLPQSPISLDLDEVFSALDEE